MAVAQGVDHLRACLEVFAARHSRHDPRAVDVVDAVPVDFFLLKEAVVFVHESPERVEIALRSIFKFLVGVASGEKGE